MPTITRDYGFPIESKNPWATITRDTVFLAENKAPLTSGFPATLQVLIAGSESWNGDQTYTNFVLGALNAYTPITYIITMDNSNPSIWAREWATGMGITFFNAYPTLQAYGYNLYQAPLTLMDNISNIIAFGTHARTTTAVTLGNLLGKSIIQV